jgi:hypothetical protein
MDPWAAVRCLSTTSDCSRFVLASMRPINKAKALAGDLFCDSSGLILLMIPRRQNLADAQPVRLLHGFESLTPAIVNSVTKQRAARISNQLISFVIPHQGESTVEFLGEALVNF